MAKGSNAVPATPSTAGGVSTEHSSGDTARVATITERSVSFEDSEGDLDANDNDHEDVDNDVYEEKAAVAEVSGVTPEEPVLSSGRSTTPRITRNLANELEAAGSDPDEDDYDEVAPGVKTSATAAARRSVMAASRPPINGDTPAAKQVFERCFAAIEKDPWMQLFAPHPTRRADWPALADELQWPVNSMTTKQVAEDTVSMLTAMGLKTMAYPSELALEDWEPAVAGATLHKWKKKLREAFGVVGINMGKQPVSRPARNMNDPRNIPLPQTPGRSKVYEGDSDEDSPRVFASKEVSPYFQDSHMVTPRSTGRTKRLERELEDRRASVGSRQRSGLRSDPRSRATEDSPRVRNNMWSDNEDNDDHNDPTHELTRQILALSTMNDSDPTPRLEVATHRPLDRITPFRGQRGKSENSLQWLRTFVYEMNGTRTPSHQWCTPFELSLREGAIYWFKQLKKDVRKDWKKLSAAFISYYCTNHSQSAMDRYFGARREKSEHLCDYLNRLNGYAKGARVKFDNGGRHGKEHIHRFLTTCGDDKLMRELYDRQITDTQELEEILLDKLKGEEKIRTRDASSRTRDASSRSSRARDGEPRREYRRNEDSYGGFSRRDDRRDRRREYDHRRDDSRNAPRVTLAEASMDDLIAELDDRKSNGRSNDVWKPRRSDESEDESSFDDYRYYDESDDDFSSDCDRRLAAANDTERRAAAEGTYGRSDRRQQRTDHNRDSSRERRPQYGPCAACGASGHSAHRCYRRCKFCKQVHDVGQCELYRNFQDLAKFVRTKVSSQELPNELQTVVREGHLN